MFHDKKAILLIIFNENMEGNQQVNRFQYPVKREIIGKNSRMGRRSSMKVIILMGESLFNNRFFHVCNDISMKPPMIILMGKTIDFFTYIMTY